MLLLSLLSLATSLYPTNEEIDNIVKSLTLEEKVGQMSQLAIDDFMNAETDELNVDFAIRALTVYKIGSVLNTYGGQGHPRQTWSRIQQQLQRYAGTNPSGIPILYGLDAIHGANYVLNATLFPQQIGLAATFNRSIVQRAAEISAYETRSASVPCTFSPVLDLGIDIRWGRFWETFGEDPYLAAELGRAMVRGFQGPDRFNIGPQHILATPKHYLGYSVPVSGKVQTPAVISENYLREYHLPPFAAAVEAGANVIIVNPAIINQLPVHASKFIMNDLLKEELKFDGFVLSEWGAIETMYSRDHIVGSWKEAIKLSINAGIDMGMIPYDLKFCDLLTELVVEEEIPMARIDDAVRRILRVKARAGLWSQPTTNSEDYPQFGSAEFERASYDAAVESITLLKNENNILPLAPGTKVLVTGPNANSVRCLDGGWSYSWQGEKANQFTAKYDTILSAIEKVNGRANTVFSEGVRYAENGLYWEDEEVSIADAVAKAAPVDVVVLVLGENSYTEKPGDLQDIALSERQVELAKAVIAVGKPVVLALNAGRPRVIDEFHDDLAAFVQLYLPANFGGNAFADILFGNANPSGKLPYNYPRYRNALINYWHKYSEEQTAQPGIYNYESDYSPLYEFGDGLSYTNYSYENLRVSRPSMGFDESLTVTIWIRNVGNRDGKESILVFISDLQASTAPDVRRLKKFTKVEIKAGDLVELQFGIRVDDLSFINTENKRVAEPGEFTITIGDQKQNFFLE
jgi:beta-glucosidase